MPRNSQIINPQFPTDDVVVIDYNVLDYGADPNSVNDSTRAIQRAIDDCYQTGGGTVWLPAGTYKVSSTLYVRAFVTLRGDWRDPDSGSGSYGTVIRAELASSETGPVLFEISGSSSSQMEMESNSHPLKPITASARLLWARKRSIFFANITNANRRNG